MAASDFASVVDAELSLLDPAVRVNRGAVDELLHADFREIGASGRLWSRAEILDLLASETASSVDATDFECTRLSPTVILLTYVSSSGVAGLDVVRDRVRSARRSSIWSRTSDGWRILFHQGTPL